MASTARRRILTSLVAGSLARVGECRRPGFSLFGIHLWGSRDDAEDPFEVIDPLPYTVTLTVTGGDGAAAAAAGRLLALDRPRDSRPPASAASWPRRGATTGGCSRALYAAGYYGPEISIRAAGQEVADLTLAVEFPPQVPIAIERRPRARCSSSAPPRSSTAPPRVPRRRRRRRDAGVGRVRDRRAGAVRGDRPGVGAVGRALAPARARQGARDRPRGDRRPRRRPARRARSPSIPGGRRATARRASSGSPRIDPAFIAFMADLEEGDSFDPDDIQAAQDRLNRLGVFRSLRFVEAEEIEPDGSLPITVRSRTAGRAPSASAARSRRSTASASPPSGSTATCFGRAERLRFDASIDGLGGSLDPDDYDYNLGVTFTKPGVFNPDTNFVTGARRAAGELRHLPREVGHRPAGLSRQFGARLTGEPSSRCRAPATTTTSASATSRPSGWSAAPPTTGATIR